MRCKNLAAWLVALGAIASCSGPHVASRQVTTGVGTSGGFEAYQRYSATHGHRLGRPRGVQLIDDGRQALYVRSGANDAENVLYALDVDSGAERVLATAAGLLGTRTVKQSSAERATDERKRSRTAGVKAFSVSNDETRVLVGLSGRLFLVDVASGEHKPISTVGYATNAVLSPDGRSVAYVHDANLFVVVLKNDKQVQLTRDGGGVISNGTADFVAQEEMLRFRGFWWSPDSRQIAFQRTDNTDVQTWYRFDARFTDQPPTSTPYPRAGTHNARVQLGVVSINSRRTRWIHWDPALVYLARVSWSKNAPLTLVLQDRAQQRLDVVAANPSTGRTSLLLRETNKTWINLRHAPKWLPNGKAFLWSTERDGGWHLDLRGQDGTFMRALAGKRIGYRTLVGLNETGTVCLVHAATDPTRQDVFAVPISSAEPARRLTTTAGAHVGSGQTEEHWVLNERGQNGSWNTLLMEGDRILREVPSQAEPSLDAPNVEWRTVGPLKIRAAIVRPRRFEVDRRYPVIVSVYGGPGYTVVQRFAHAYQRDQLLADEGFVVVMFDARGTPHRGTDWERATYQNLIELPLADQKDALQTLGREIPEMDMSRVGIVGWSFGGYFAAMAVMRYPEVFHAAVAGAPVADWTDYDTHYTERYLGHPKDAPSVYKAHSLLTHAPALRRPLLIVHGTVDDNVYFAHALKLSNALLRAGKPHQLLPLSGATHMVGDPLMSVRLKKHIVHFFKTQLGAGTER